VTALAAGSGLTSGQTRERTVMLEQASVPDALPEPDAPAWIVEPGARPRLGQLVHEFRAQAFTCRSAFVVQVWGDDATFADAKIQLVSSIRGRPERPMGAVHGGPPRRWETYPSAPGRTPYQPVALLWHRLDECSGEPRQLPGVTGVTPTPPSTDPRPGDLVHRFMALSGECAPAVVQRVKLDTILSVAAVDGSGMSAVRHRVAPAKTRLGDPPDLQDRSTTWHRVDECPSRR
jgi:hypothetical protein